MLTRFEQFLFIMLAVLAIGATYSGFRDMWLIVNRGEGQLYLDNLPQRAWKALRIYLGQETTLKTRRISSLFHIGIVWGFTYYFLVNGLDTFRGFIPGFLEWLENFGVIYSLYRLVGDILSIAVLVGVTYFLLRRFVLPNKAELTYHDNILLHPKVKAGAIQTDSLVVGLFILLHVGARFLGESVYVAHPGADFFMPFATLVSPIWGGMSADTLTAMEHVFVFSWFPSITWRTQRYENANGPRSFDHGCGSGCGKSKDYSRKGSEVTGCHVRNTAAERRCKSKPTS